MTRLITVLFVFGLFIFEEVASAPYIRMGLDTHPFVKIICPNCEPGIRMSNWGGNFQFSTPNIQYPRTVEEVQKVVKAAKGRIRCLGMRHSFSTVADCTDTIISTLHLNNILGLDPSIPSVTVEAGIAYTDLCPFLESVGFALPNLATLAEISVGGASSTGAHGSGVFNGNLATQIRSLKIVLANGTLATIGPNDPQLKAIALGLGVFGVIVHIELNIEPTFKMKNHVFLNMSNEDVYNHFDEIENMGYTSQFFTDFSSLTHWNQVWVNVKTTNDTVGAQPNLFGAPRAPAQVTPIAALPVTYIMEQNKELPWYEALVDYRLGLSGFDGAEIQCEWIMPYENAVPAIKAVSKFGAEIRPIVYTMLIRTIAGDDLWMSAMYKERSVAVHFTFQPNMTAVLNLIPKIEKALKPFKARPHFGKVFTMKAEEYLQYYPKLKDFKKLADKLDPQGKFRNAFIEKNVFVGDSLWDNLPSSPIDTPNPWDWLFDLINKNNKKK